MSSEEVPKDGLGTPVTKMPFEQRLHNATNDLVVTGLMSSTHALNRMRVTLRKIYERRKPTAVDATDSELSALFGDAWSIIYSLDRLRRVLGQELDEAPQETSSYELSQMLQLVRKARNGLEHIDAKKIALTVKKADFPILGVICATFLERKNVVNGEVTSLDHMLLSHSDFHSRMHFRPVSVELQSIVSPVDHIRLFAFGKVVDLSRVVKLAEEATNVLAVRQVKSPDRSSRFRVIIEQTFNQPTSVSLSS